MSGFWALKIKKKKWGLRNCQSNNLKYTKKTIFHRTSENLKFLELKIIFFFLVSQMHKQFKHNENVKAFLKCLLITQCYTKNTSKHDLDDCVEYFFVNSALKKIWF